MEISDEIFLLDCYDYLSYSSTYTSKSMIISTSTSENASIVRTLFDLFYLRVGSKIVKKNDCLVHSNCLGGLVVSREHYTQISYPEVLQLGGGTGWGGWSAIQLL